MNRATKRAAFGISALTFIGVGFLMGWSAAKADDVLGFPDGFDYRLLHNQTVTIKDNHGGRVGYYTVIADTVKQLKDREGIHIKFRFDGACESSCTLFRQMLVDHDISTCHTQKAVFGYHMLKDEIKKEYSVPYDYLPRNIIHLVKMAGGWRTHEFPTVKFDYHTLDKLYDWCR